MKYSSWVNERRGLRRRSALPLPWLAILSLGSLLPGLRAENELHNASFEVVVPDLVSPGYNRYFPYRDDVALRVATAGVEVRTAEDMELEDLGELVEEPGPKGWRMVQEPGKAWHGKISLRTDIKDAYSWCTEVKGGFWTFSVYAISRDKEMLRITATDIRGRKGEIRHKQDKAFDVGPEWTRCVFTCRVVNGPVTWTAETLGDGTVWIDACQLEPGKNVSRFQLHPWDQTPPRDISEKLVIVEPPACRGIRPAAPEVLVRAGKTGAIPLHISARPDVPAGPIPASGGIPLPRGHVYNQDRLAVYDSNGRQAPCQFRTLSRHVMDGSIQMVLVDLVASSPSARYTLRYGPQVEQSRTVSPLSIAESDD